LRVLSVIVRGWCGRGYGLRGGSSEGEMAGLAPRLWLAGADCGETLVVVPQSPALLLDATHSSVAQSAVQDWIGLFSMP
jgi:hypothetical protein